MASIFTKIIDGDLPGTFVWKDDTCVAFMSIAPLRPGHTLVVPRREVDDWLDLDAATMHHLIDVSQTIGAALDHAYRPAKVGLMIAGLEVPHVHVHVVPIDRVHDLDFANADAGASGEDLDAAAATVTGALAALGYEHGLV